MSMMTKPDNWLKVGLETDQYCYTDDINEHLGPYRTPSTKRRQAQRTHFLLVSARRSYNFYILHHVD